MRIRHLTVAAAALLAAACTAQVDSSGTTTGALDPSASGAGASGASRPRVLLAALLPELREAPAAGELAPSPTDATPPPRPILVPFFVPAPDVAAGATPTPASKPTPPTGCVVHKPVAADALAGMAPPPPMGPPPGDGSKPDGARPPLALDAFVAIDGGGALAAKSLRLGDLVLGTGANLALTWTPPPAPPSPDGAAKPTVDAPPAVPGLTVLQIAVFAHAPATPTAPTAPTAGAGAKLPDAPPPLADAVLECFVADGATHVEVPSAQLAEVLAAGTGADAIARVSLAHFAPPPPPVDGHGATPPPAPGEVPAGGGGGAPPVGSDGGRPLPPPPIGHGVTAQVALGVAG